MRSLLCALAILGMAGLVQADVDWEGDNNGAGDGWDFNNGSNWDDGVNPVGDGWNIHRRDYGYYVPFKAWDIHVTSSIATGGATVYQRVVEELHYPVTVTVNENVSLTMAGELVLQPEQSIIIKPGASLIMGPSFDLADQQINLGYTEVGTPVGAYMKVESGGRAAAGFLRHDNGSVLDLYGTFRTWQITRISADPGYALNVHNGGLVWVEDMSVAATAWAKGGKITQYLCSTVQLRGDRTAIFENYVQQGETGVWMVDYDVTRSDYTTIRLRPADACDFTVSPTEVGTWPGAGCPGSQAHELTITNTTAAGGASLNYTVVEVSRDGVETDVPWLSVDKYTGGPIAPSGTDIVTATVDYTKLEVGANAAWLRFAVDCDPCSRFDVKFIAPSILNYNGDMNPTSPNSAGPGLNWTAFNMAGTIDEAVEPYPDTLDNAVWKMTDGPGAKKQYKSNPMNIGSLQGATIVARVAVTVKIAPSGENIGIKHDAGASAGYHWGGAGYSSPYNAPGHVKETERGDQLWIEDQGPEFYAGWHILRLTAKGDNGDAGPRTIRLYLDEDPTPIIEIPNAVSKPSTDMFTFGTPSTDGHQVIYFDWITATDAGAFGPGEEDDCIGQSLCLGPGCYESPCNIDVFADADEDGDVDQADFAVFQLCYTGDGGGVLSDPEYCQCLDRRNNDNSSGQDNDIDSFDLAAFEDCASGPGVPADLACDD